ncbi:hypothetical protein [Streptomyces erythrochromogenes]|uniref:hypothetical protein n=1 Tax=Streptomyces erythrochromogenes TaxID=285574 RepID=UPI0037FC85CA
MESLSSEAPRTIERLHSLSTELGAFGELLAGARPVAGSGGLPTLASWYATAQGLSATTLVLLLSTAEQPYAHTTVSGHHAVDSLGQLVKASSDITAHVMGAVAVAAEYHRVDGLPDPDTGRMTAQPAVRRQALDQHITSAFALIKSARAACHNAAAFTETAALREATRPARSAPAPAHKAGPAPTAAPPKLTAAQHRALHLIHTSTVTYSQWPRKRPAVSSGSPERITTRSVDSLMEKRLIRRDVSSSLHQGQRLHPTDAGLQALRRLGPAPEPAAPAQPRHPGPFATR